MSFDQLIGQFHHVKCTHIQVQRQKNSEHVPNRAACWLTMDLLKHGAFAYDLNNGGTMGKPMGPATFEKVNSFSLMSQ